jgi:hypothetical protein
MQAVFETFGHYSHGDQGRVHESVLAVKNWLGNIFGCPHKELSRPFSRQGESYRVCINCGAHRRFDAQTWNMKGPFYFNPATTSDLVDVNVSALRMV